jgi:hypothetical protein
VDCEELSASRPTLSSFIWNHLNDAKLRQIQRLAHSLQVSWGPGAPPQRANCVSVKPSHFNRLEIPKAAHDLF